MSRKSNKVDEYLNRNEKKKKNIQKKEMIINIEKVKT
jgi:hypothetical protein